MTGTSCDALDGSLMSVHGKVCREEGFFSVRYPQSLRERVLKIQTHSEHAGLEELLTLDRDLGLWIGEAARLFLKKQKKVDAIACHGQTIGHFPFLSPQGKTLQIGDPAIIAHETRLTVIHHFRDGDLAAHGQGAPLLPKYHQMLGARLGGEVSFHNLGGVSNLSYIGKKGEVLAFDTGPANLWIDESVRLHSGGRIHFDRGGKLASKGVPDLSAIERLMKLSYFKSSPPKSTGRDDFAFSLLKKYTKKRGVDLIATATELSAVSIADAYKNFVLTKGRELRCIYFCGGGAKNKTLLSRISSLLPGVQISTVEKLGLRSEGVEAQGFAYFGALVLQGLSLSGPWTGASPGARSGSITPGEGWSKLLRKIAQHNP